MNEDKVLFDCLRREIRYLLKGCAFSVKNGIIPEDAPWKNTVQARKFKNNALRTLTMKRL